MENSTYELVKALSSAIVNVPETDNVSTNRKLWDVYAREWNKKEKPNSHSSTDKNINKDESQEELKWLQNMSSAVGITNLDDLTTLGNEWSDKKSFEEILTSWLFPIVNTVNNNWQHEQGTNTTVIPPISIPSSSIPSPSSIINPSLLSSTSLSIAEIGSGGGRVTKFLAPYSKYYHCYDISNEMLHQCQQTILHEYGPIFNQERLKYYSLSIYDGEVYWPCINNLDTNYNERFAKYPIKNITSSTSSNKMNTVLDIMDKTMSSSSLSPAPTSVLSSLSSTAVSHKLPNEPVSISNNTNQKYDIIICFDVLVHCDMHAIFNTLRAIRAMLQPHGRAIISTSNLLAPLGWDRFISQRKDTPAGFYWITPEAINTLITKCGLYIIRKSWPPLSDEQVDSNGLRNNIYYDRDYLVEVGIYEK